MKMNIRIIAAAVLLALTSGAAMGQTPEDDRQLDRQVDVSRDYTPDVDKAMKIAIIPDINDTVALRPDLEYSITPNPWVTGFGVAAINPVRVSPGTYNPLRPFYLKAGGGAPGQTLFDIYASTTGVGGGHIGGYANHYGQYGKIKNDIGFKARGLHSTNSVGVFGKAFIGRRIAVEGELGFDYDLWSRYGQSVDIDAPGTFVAEDIKSKLQSYSIPRAQVTLGNDFTDLSYFNFRIGAGTYVLSDRSDNKETGVNAFIELGQRFNVHNFIFKGEFDGAFGGDDRQGEIHRIYKFGLDYSIETEKFKLGAGADFAHKAHSGTNSKSYVLPRFKILFNITDGSFIPYASLESSLVDNTYYNLTRVNPYINPDAGTAAVTRKYDIRGGITGSIASNLMYNLYVGWGTHKDPVFFYTDYSASPQTAVFGVIADKRMNVFSGGVELDGRISGSFSTGLSGHFYNYSMKNLGEASGLPKFDASLYLRYSCREKFNLRLAAELTGKRKFMEFASYDPAGSEPYYTKQDAAVDLSLEAEYFINQGFGVFLLGKNLGNSKIYRFNHYPDKGIGISAGVKLLF